MMHGLKLGLVLLFVGSIRAAYFRDLSKHMRVGTSLGTHWMVDPRVMNMTGAYFNILSPEDEMKWKSTEQIRGKYNYRTADIIVNYAETHNMTFRGHNLVWHSSLPPWLNGSLSKTELHDVMVKRIKDIVTRYKGKLYAWDVVNEPMDYSGALRDSFWTRNFGDTYIAEAFKLTKQYDPKVKLYLNEYRIESNKKKLEGFYNLVKKLLSQGVPIEGIGFQCHGQAGHTALELPKIMKRFLDLGLEVAITELDVALAKGDKAELEAQAKDYAFYYKTCLETKGCVGTTVWGYTDKFSWRGGKHPCLWDADFKPRPAVAAVEEVLRASNSH